ncbi:MAG: V-type ATPase subunit [Polyangiales bacterium]
MARYLGDINARARGLRTHLLAASELERLASASSLMTLQRELSALGLVRSEAPATPASLELAIRRYAAGQMAVLERWCGGARRATLAVIFEDEDRRSIQSIIRGAAQGTASDVRMGGLVPTGTLGEGALRTLSIQPTPADVVRVLVLWGHPFGAPLVGAVNQPNPSLFEIEVGLARTFARRASAHAREGGRQLVEYVQQVVDVLNAWSALLHFAESDPLIVDLTFIEGGRWLSRDLYVELMGFDSLRDVSNRLAWELRKTALASAFRGETQDLSELESAVLGAQIAWQKRSVRIDPSGAAPVIGFAIELRTETLNLRRIIWGVALRAPAALIQAEMVVE